MLSRVADALFWMSRYVERAEQVARLLDVCFHLDLDLRGVLAGPHEFQWSALAAILQQIVPPAERPANLSRQTAISNWLTFDANNPSSIVSCVTRARSNARSIRNALERARLRQAKRLFDTGGQPSREDLMTIEAEDILASRVFGDDGEGEADSETIEERDAASVAAAGS